MPNFTGEIGQRYKIHYKKGYNTGNMEGKDPNRYYVSGVYTGSYTFVNPVGISYLRHRFTDIVWPHGPGVDISLFDEDFGVKYDTVKQTSGGKRRSSRRRQSRKQKKRRSTRRH